MTVRVRVRHGFALIAAGGLVAASLFAIMPSAAHADTPTPPVASAFNAPLCEGTTPDDPTEADGPVPDLTRVFGQRLADYNAGLPVILYSSTGGNGGVTPNCSVRYTEGVGPVSSWSYCTDQSSALCNGTDEEGRLTQGGTILPGLQVTDDNPRLSSDQEKVIAYVLQRNLPVTPLPYDLAPGAATADNMTHVDRQARQFLVWCISDRSNFNFPTNQEIGQWCDANIGQETQQSYLAAMNAPAVLTLAPSQQTVTVGQPARVVVTTNVYDQPIALTLSSGTATVCSGTATLNGDVLTVPGTDPTTTTSVTLCVDSDSASEVAVSASGAVTSLDRVTWAQSPGMVGTKPCQVYAEVHSAATPVSATASVKFELAPTPTPTPTSPEPSASGNAGPGSGATLANSGSSTPWGSVAIAVLLLLAGSGALVLRRSARR